MDYDRNQREIFRLFGLFIIQWQIYENVLEVYIQKRTQLSPLNGNIILSSLQAKAKSSIAKSLLSLDGDEKSIKLIRRMDQESKRNSLVHGQALVSEGELIFIKRNTDKGRFSSTRNPYSADTFRKHLQQVSDMMMELEKSLGVSNDDLKAYVAIGIEFADQKNA